ncbi:MAG: hypothetical protein LBK00_08925 [Treponema sp.]|nr:hypothetical protein [Treponema sp.]
MPVAVEEAGRASTCGAAFGAERRARLVHVPLKYPAAHGVERSIPVRQNFLRNSKKFSKTT